MRISATLTLTTVALPFGVMGCAGPKVPVTTDASISVLVAPIDLPLASDVCYALSVFGTAEIEDMNATSLIWTQPNLCASDFGTDGGIRFTGVCDAQAGGSDEDGSALDPDHNNTVMLVLNDIYTGGAWDGDGVALTPSRDYINPCPEVGDGQDNGCILKVPCTANQDEKVLFNLTVMRDAQLGFFDTVVKFQDVFCAAKLDCVEDDNTTLTYLYDPNATPPGDGPTVVLGFACLGGDGEAVHMYLDDLLVTCSTGSGETYTATRTATVDPTGGPGNLASPHLSQSGSPAVLFGAAVNTGEGFQGAQFWNVLLGLNLPGQAGETCTLTTTGTVSEAALDDNTTPANTRYPFIDWTVDLTEDGNRTCTRHPLNGDDGGVETLYTPFDSPEHFDHALTFASNTAGDFCGGTGTASDPYLICTLADLAELDAKLSDPETWETYTASSYRQVNDLDFGGVPRAFLPIGVQDQTLAARHEIVTALFNPPSSMPFLGHYDGNGKHLANLAFVESAAADYQGLFVMLGAGSVVEDLVFDAPRFDLADTVVAGTVAAYSAGRVRGVTIDDLDANLGRVSFFGGVVGVQSGGQGIDGLRITGSIAGSLVAGAGGNDNDPGTAQTHVVAGVAALLLNVAPGVTTTVSDPVVDVAIDVGGIAAGALCYQLGQTALLGVDSQGTVHSRLGAAGVANWVASGELMGISGLTAPTLEGVLNSGDVLVTGTSANCTRAAGVINYAFNVSLSDVHNRGDVTNDHLIAGGAAGIANDASGVLSRVSSSGNITNRALQTDSSGAPRGYSDVAGLVGFIADTRQLTLSDCYSTGHLSAGPGENDIGGLIADIWDLTSPGFVAVSNCYAANTFSGGNAGYGAAIGRVYVTADPPPSMIFANIYWNTDTGSATITTGYSEDPPGLLAPAAFVGLSSTEMQLQASFDGRRSPGRLQSVEEQQHAGGEQPREYDRVAWGGTRARTRGRPFVYGQQGLRRRRQGGPHRGGRAPRARRLRRRQRRHRARWPDRADDVPGQRLSPRGRQRLAQGLHVPHGAGRRGPRVAVEGFPASGRWAGVLVCRQRGHGRARGPGPRHDGGLDAALSRTGPGVHSGVRDRGQLGGGPRVWGHAARRQRSHHLVASGRSGAYADDRRLLRHRGRGGGDRDRQRVPAPRSRRRSVRAERSRRADHPDLSRWLHPGHHARPRPAWSRALRGVASQGEGAAPHGRRGP